MPNENDFWGNNWTQTAQQINALLAEQGQHAASQQAAQADQAGILQRFADRFGQQAERDDVYRAVYQGTYASTIPSYNGIAHWDDPPSTVPWIPTTDAERRGVAAYREWERWRREPRVELRGLTVWDWINGDE